MKMKKKNWNSIEKISAKYIYKYFFLFNKICSLRIYAMNEVYIDEYFFGRKWKNLLYGHNHIEKMVN